MIAQQAVNGLVAGAAYTLFALGLTLIFGVHKILNLAHGGIFMAGAFIGVHAVTAGLPLPLALIVAMLGSGILSVLVDIVAFRRLRRSGQVEFAAIVSSIGANLVLVSVAQRLSASDTLRFPFGTFPVVFFRGFGLRISLLQLVVAGCVTILLLGLTWYIHHTSFGRQVRATAGNERTAALLGVNPGFVYFQTFFLSGALAGAAGVLIGLSFNTVHFLMGDAYLLRAFVVVVLGGIGSIPGTVVAGLLLGVIQTLTAAYLPSGLGDTIIFSLLFLLLLLRPQGLLGTQLVLSGVGRR